MLAPREDGMGSGLHTALIQDPAMAQGKTDNGVYDHGHTAFQRKGEGAPFGHATSGWPRASPAADPLFPEPETTVPKPFNGGAARWGANDGEAKRQWAGGRANPRAEGAELRRAPIGQAPAANGARRWDDTRPQERTSHWNGESRPAAREPRDVDATWRGGGAGMGTARFAPPKNDIHWRKGDPPGPAARSIEVKREASATHGAAAPNFAAAHGLVPGARAPTGTRPAPAYGARVPQGLKKYRKEELLGVLTTMKQQVGDHLPLPEGSNLEDGVKELWRADAGWSAAQWHGAPQAAPSAPPGLDPYIQKLHSVLPQLSSVGIPSPLQVLKMGTYFYKDPQGVVHGPFTAENLISWNTQGYLYPELECATSAEAQTFFPFSRLGDLWAMQNKLGLKAEDVQKLADAEGRLAKQPAPPPAPAAPVHDNVNVHHQVPAEQHAPFMAAQAMHNAAAMNPAAVSDHHVTATDGGWDAPPVDQRHGQKQRYSQAPRPNPIAAAQQNSALYDPIDDIIDDGLPRVVAIAPGERTLQPFTGMGMGGAPPAPSAVAPAPQYIAPDAGHIGAQQANRAVPDAMENLHIADAPARRVEASARRVDARAPAGAVDIGDLFGEQAPAQGAAAPKGSHAAEPANAQRIAPSQLFAQFDGAQGAAANGTSREAMAMQGLPVQPPAPPPRAAAAQQAASAPRWGGAQPVRPAKFDEIQAEKMRKRRQEDAAAQAAAKNQMAQAEAERARRAAWAAQPKPVNFRQIVEDDEECAADMEGGGFEGEEDDLDVQPMGYNPWQGQAALPADGRAHPGAHLGVDIFRQGVAAEDDAAAAPAVPPPPARTARTAAQVLGQDTRAVGAQNAPRRAAAANAAKPAWQANAGRPAEHVAPAPPPPAADMLQEPEPEILKNNPDFYEWCMLEMDRLQGDINILVVLLETGANCEIMDFARSNLKGDNIGAFVSEFIKRKAQAAAAKPAGRKRRGSKTAAAAAGAAVAPQAAPARAGAGPVAAETVGDGWESVGAKGKQRRNVKPGAAAQNGGKNMRLGGGAFAVLPSS